MRPFHNKGWPHLHKFESILPQSGVKGKHAYAPASTNPALLHGNDSDPEPTNKKEVEAGSADALQGGEDGGNKMDVDGVRALAVASASKWSFSATSLDDPPPSSSLVALCSSGPLRKKRSSTPSSAASTHSSLITSCALSSAATTWSKQSSLTKIMPAVAITSMQGSINRLTDVFEKTMAAPLNTVAAKQDNALQILQTQDAGSLSRVQMRKVVEIFTVNPASVTTYIALSNDEIRWDWLHGPQMLGDWDDKLRLMGPSSM